MEDKGYYYTKESVDEYIQMAKDVNSLQLIEKLRKHLPARSLMLEVGSGPGTDWQILSKDYQVVGSDNSNEFLHRLKAKYPQGEFLQLDACTMDVNRTFDGIYSNKVLHHLSDKELQSSIQAQLPVLNKGGVICHSFWLGEGTEEFKGMFVNYHSKDELSTLFADAFEILVLEPYREFEENDSIVLIGRKK
ncbi:class I SAM-dependent methyltransferase [Labilibacter sediminis]|nr:class I SAM-dependent methyltransferase [Labilibacter sediminis]